MMNKKIQVRGENKTYQLWFNNFALMEIAHTFGVEQSEILRVCEEKMSDNFLVLISDLFLAGYKGEKLAKGDLVELERKDVSEIVATADMGDLTQIWEVFLDVNGMNIKTNKKKTVKKGTTKKKS